jgi:hypothetical protein
MKKTNLIIAVAAIILIIVLYLFLRTISDILLNFGVV